MKKWFIPIITILLFGSCAHRESYAPIAYKNLLQKKDNVFSLWWKGKIDIKTNREEVSASVIVVAKKDPLCIRIELTNWISGTFAYGFIKKRRFVFLSLKEKKAYIGKLPTDIKEKDVWSLIRALPIDTDASKITFQNGKIIFISNRFKISYKDYSLKEGIVFARHISICLNKTLNLKAEIKKAEFNKSIPPQLFSAVIPAKFQIIRYQVPSF